MAETERALEVLSKHQWHAVVTIMVCRDQAKGISQTLDQLKGQDQTRVKGQDQNQVMGQDQTQVKGQDLTLVKLVKVQDQTLFKLDQGQVRGQVQT